MVCIYCRSKTEIINTRHQNRSNTTWRRRKCLKCGAVFTSIEAPDYSKTWVVSDSTGKIKPFKRDKLFLSIYDSLKHRKTAISDGEALTATIMSKLANLPSNGHINKSVLVDIALAILKRFDKTAAVHYKAYYTN